MKRAVFIVGGVLLAIFLAGASAVTKVGGSGTTKVGGSGTTKVAAYVSPFSPDDIAGLQLWLVGDDAPSGSISTWADASGQSNDLSQATAGKQPTKVAAVINGHAIVRLDGADDYLDRSDSGFITGDFTAFTVVYCSSASLSLGTYQNVLTWGTADVGDSVFIMFGDDGNIGADGFGVSQYGDATGVANQLQAWRVFTVSRSGNNYTIYVDGVSSAAKTMTSTTTLGSQLRLGSYNDAVGAGSYLNGDVAEVVIYSSALSTPNREAVEDYLGARYAITITH